MNAEDCCQITETRGGKEGFCTVAFRAKLCDTLILDIKCPEQGDKKFQLFLSYLLFSTCLRQP